jgi:hypothetical protein
MKCSASFTPSAIRAGCFHSSPTDPHAWYDLSVHNAYQTLALNDGLSMTGKCRGQVCHRGEGKVRRAEEGRATTEGG